MKPRIVVLSLLLMSGLSTKSAAAQRVVRADLAVSPGGGTRSDGPEGLRLTTREWSDYKARAPGMGFRAVRTAP